MDYVKAKEHYRRKKYGKCINCVYGVFKKSISNSFMYCDIREEPMSYDLFLDSLAIKFCKYYEEENK